jgi:hypothetical protein
MVQRQRTIEEFGRIRLGKPETVSKHKRSYDIKPKLDKKTKEHIQKGKAKRIKKTGEKIEFPITICSGQKTSIKKGIPKNLYNNRRITSFSNHFPYHLILSRKNGLMFSNKTYAQYGDDEEQTDEELLKILKTQAKKYPNLKLNYYNPRPLTHDKWVNLLKEAGFEVRDFRSVKDYKQNIPEDFAWNDIEKSQEEKFIKTFKDTNKIEKKAEQKNLDKELMINTKLLKEYGDIKSFDKSQQRLGAKEDLKGKEKSWLKNQPFTKEQEESFNRYTHFPIDINKEYNKEVNNKEEIILNKLGLLEPRDLPEEVSYALGNYRKELYNWYLAKSRSYSVAPPVSVVGGSKYRGNIEKASGIERSASERLEKAKKKLDIKIRKEKTKQQIEAPKNVSFGERGKNINQMIRSIRKEAKGSITQSYKGKSRNKEWRIYIIEPNDKEMYQIQLSETGSYNIMPYGSGGSIKSGKVNSLDEIKKEIVGFMKLKENK